MENENFVYNMLKDLSPIQRKRILRKAEIKFERVIKKDEKKEKELISMISKQAIKEFRINKKSKQEIKQKYFKQNKRLNDRKEKSKRKIIQDENEIPKRKLINRDKLNKQNNEDEKVKKFIKENSKNKIDFPTIIINEKNKTKNRKKVINFNEFDNLVKDNIKNYFFETFKTSFEGMIKIRRIEVNKNIDPLLFLEKIKKKHSKKLNQLRNQLKLNYILRVNL